MVIGIDDQIAKGIIWILYFVGVYFSLFWLSVLVFDSSSNSRKKYKVWPTVSIILPMYNEEDAIEMTLDSVFNLDYPKKKLKIICVNDGSTDNTLKIVKKINKKYDFILINQKNQGKYVALNNALKKIDSDFFACFDADSFTDSNSLKSMIEEFDEKNVAAVMPIMKVHNPENLLQQVQWLEYIINIFYKYIMGKIDCIHVTPGPFSIYRTKYVKELGGFRKAHLTEDLEMALRLQDNHYKLKQSLDAVVYTKSPKRLKAFISQRTRWYQGTFFNIKDYKHFLFNKEYGEFGFFHIPLVAITGFLGLLGVLTVIYLFLKGLFHTLNRWYLTNFDFVTYITSFKFNTTLLDLNWQTLFQTTVLFSLIFIVIYLSFIGTKERINFFKGFKYFFMFIYFFLIYKFIIGYIWAKVTFRIIFKKANKWDKVND